MNRARLSEPMPEAAVGLAPEVAEWMGDIAGKLQIAGELKG